jgi:ASC-1-like (ASCH) protein
MKKAIKICSLLIALVLLIGAMPVSLSVSAGPTTIQATGMNKVRGEGDLIYYDSTYGSTTKTNEWGYEVVVDSNNKVIKAGGYDNKIPSGGFVLSGHNTSGEVKKGKELEDNIKVGDYVYFNKQTLEITVSDQPIKQSSFYNIAHTINGTNIICSTDYMVIYNRAGSRTGTNEWGYEVIVENNIVTQMGGNDNLIPNSGYVVSGHGESAEWLKKKIKLGMTVTYDSESQTITFEYSAESAIFNIQIKIKNIESEFATAKENFRYIDYNAITEKLEAAKNSFETAKSNYKKNKKRTNWTR